LSLQIRPAQLRDLAAIEAIYREHAQHVAGPYHGATVLRKNLASTRLWFLLNHTFASILPIASPADQVFVGETSSGIAGFVQAQSAPPGRHVWEVVNLCLRPHMDNFQAATALLDHLFNEGLKRGVARFLVRISQNDPSAELFRARGFRAYATEHALLSDSIRRREAEPLSGWRQMRQSDQLALYLLYRSSTPRDVSSVEGQTFSEWRQAFQQGSWTRAVPRSTRRRQYLVDRSEVMAWMGITPGSGGRPNSLGLMALSRPLDLWPDLVQQAMAYLADHLPGPVWCNLRHYDQRGINLLQKEGFEIIASQVLMVKELGIKIPVRAAVKAREKRLVPQYG
jgi:ribosomal protein S18 acetylase RimI-like enzyme